MKPIRLNTEGLTLHEIREQYTCLARVKYGKLPRISRETAKYLSGVSTPPRVGYEIYVGDNKYGGLYIQNLSGDFFVEVYMDVNKSYNDVPASFREELVDIIKASEEPQ